jgi:hypothetical protein
MNLRKFYFQIWSCFCRASELDVIFNSHAKPCGTTHYYVDIS